MGADDPHYDVTTWVLETLRESSIARASQSIEVSSDLSSAQRSVCSKGALITMICVWAAILSRVKAKVISH